MNFFYEIVYLDSWKHFGTKENYLKLSKYKKGEIKEKNLNDTYALFLFRKALKPLRSGGFDISYSI